MTTLNPCLTFPQSGTCIYLPFPDLAKPVPGGWTVSVSLRATTTPVPTDIMVQQGGKVLASMRITPTTSYATYDLSLSDADIAKGTTGLCHISGPLVVICETTPSGCCPDGVPNTLTATFTYGVTIDCPTPCGSFTTTMTWNGSGWHGGGTFDCGIAVTADLMCIDGRWHLYVTACEFPDYDFTPMGTPVCSPFSANFGASIAGEHCCPDGSHVSGMLVSITE